MNGLNKDMCRSFGEKTSRKAATYKMSTRGKKNIRVYLKDTGWEGMNWIHLV